MWPLVRRSRRKKYKNRRHRRHLSRKILFASSLLLLWIVPLPIVRCRFSLHLGHLSLTFTKSTRTALLRHNRPSEQRSVCQSFLLPSFVPSSATSFLRPDLNRRTPPLFSSSFTRERPFEQFAVIPLSRVCKPQPPFSPFCELCPLCHYPYLPLPYILTPRSFSPTAGEAVPALDHLPFPEPLVGICMEYVADHFCSKNRSSCRPDSHSQQTGSITGDNIAPPNNFLIPVRPSYLCRFMQSAFNKKNTPQ